jgi:transglutaminase-like putative cysteine protease
VFSISIFTFSYQATAQKLHESVSIEQQPTWVESREVVLDSPVPIDEISGGVFYRLVDNQVKVENDGSRVIFSRYVESVVNQTGVERSSQINLDFDPSYQTLHLHSLDIIRNGNRINKTESTNISVVNRETDLSNQIYNGSLSLNMIVDDLQIGDVIDYSYSRVGANPVYKGIFSYSRSINWSVPVQNQFVRILWGKNKPLKVDLTNLDKEVKQSNWNGYKQYQVNLNFEQTINRASQTPDWFDSYAHVYFNESENWENVGDWAEPMYRFDLNHTSINEVVRTIKNSYSTKDERIVAALKYVQNEIRYFGIEMGENSHMPTAPEQTLKLKYGDCKDKVVVFLSLLAGLEVEAYPALVNTDDTKLLKSLPPGVGRFDHVIATLFHKGKQLWLDPTMSNQFGLLADLYQPNFGYALVLKEGQAELTEMVNVDQYSKIAITETYSVEAGDDADATLAVNTEYYGHEASLFLNRIERDGKAALSEDYEIYYQGFFASLLATAGVDVKNNPTLGITELNEAYTIPKIWHQNDDFSIDFYPTDIRNAVKKVTEINRTTPLALTFPNKISNNFIVQFSEDGWNFDNETSEEDNEYFKFTEVVEFSDNVLTIRNEYQSKADHVPASKIDDYIEARKRLQDIAYFGIEKFKEDANSTNSPNDDALDKVTYNSKYTDWLNSIVVVCFITFLVIMFFWRKESGNRPDFETTAFSPISVIKFLFLSILTTGIYSIYWIYRNWLAIKVANNVSIMPVGRAIFNIIWFYPLMLQAIEHSKKQFNENKVMPIYVAVLLSIAYIFLSIADFFSDVDALLYISIFLTPVLFLPLLIYINKVSGSENEAYIYNSKWRITNTLTVILFAPIWLYVAATFTNYLPSSSVILEKDMLSSDLKYLYRQRVLPANETISHFYSAASFDIREDGNGFTENRVFSYWVDENSTFEFRSATYDKINNINVKQSESDLEDTIVTIVLRDESEFLLFVSAVDKGDIEFVDTLKSNWKQYEKTQ